MAGSNGDNASVEMVRPIVIAEVLQEDDSGRVSAQPMRIDSANDRSAKEHLPSSSSRSHVHNVNGSNSGTRPSTPSVGTAKIASARVQGSGMWKSWTRSFNKPIMAALDLFDNAIDACLHDGSADEHSVSGTDRTFDQRRTPTIILQSDMSVRKSVTDESDNLGRVATASRPGLQPIKTPDETASAAINKKDKGAGLILVNSSHNPIPPMDQILTVYRSSKQNDSDIGENGVGIKQACAHLSDVSLIFTKSNHNHFGLGVLSKDLQRDDPILPAVQFPHGSMSGNHARRCMTLTNLVNQNPDTFGIAFEAYGSTAENIDADHALEVGIEMAAKVFMAIVERDEWKDHPNVFLLLMCKMRHSGALTGSSSEQDDDGYGPKSTNSSLHLLKELQEELPKRYLHIPKHFHIQVQRTRINFQYWERRLADLTRFDVAYSKRVPYQVMENWDRIEEVLAEQKTQSQNDPVSNGHLADPLTQPSQSTIANGGASENYRERQRDGEREGGTTQDAGRAEDVDNRPISSSSSSPSNSPSKTLAREARQKAMDWMAKQSRSNRRSPKAARNTASNNPIDESTISRIRVWCGFDSIRCARNKSAPMAVYLHSRVSGRLIKHWKDGRSEFSLPHSGSDYCQGMTVIIDDVNGTFPLNPTKQDVAFGLESHGEVHSENMHAWVGGCTHTYWWTYCDVLGVKSVIKAVVENTYSIACEHAGLVVGNLTRRPSEYPQLSTGSFLRFEGLKWGKPHGQIRTNKPVRSKLRRIHGEDCCIRLDLSVVPEARVPRRRGRREDEWYDTGASPSSLRHKRKSPMVARKSSTLASPALMMRGDIDSLVHGAHHTGMPADSVYGDRLFGLNNAASELEFKLRQYMESNKELHAELQKRDQTIRELRTRSGRHGAKVEADTAKLREYRARLKNEQTYAREMEKAEKVSSDRCRELQKENMALTDENRRLRRKLLQQQNSNAVGIDDVEVSSSSSSDNGSNVHAGGSSDVGDDEEEEAQDDAGVDEPEYVGGDNSSSISSEESMDEQPQKRRRLPARKATKTVARKSSRKSQAPTTRRTRSSRAGVHSDSG